MTRHLPEETLGQRIARLRSQRGWTQQQLADRIAASRVAVSHFEMGLALPSERTLVLLAGFFRVEPHALIAETQYPEAKADKLPAVAPRYTEVEMQLALFNRDIGWAKQLGASALTTTFAEWKPRFASLLASTNDTEEYRLLVAAIAQCGV